MKRVTDFRIDRVRVVFKECELGIAGVPVFRILPETFAAGADGACAIAAARRTTVVLGLELLDRGFAALLDSSGKFTGIPPEVFRTPGGLRLEPADEASMPVCEFPCARLVGTPGYGVMPNAGHRLILEFEIVPPSPGAPYMVCR